MLFIDDDKEILSLIPVILAEENICVVTAESFDDLSKLAGIRPDLIMLDEWLGRKFGSSICREIKCNLVYHQVPVILISALFNIEEIARNCNADGFIQKPFDISHLIKVVNSFLQK